MTDKQKNIIVSIAVVIILTTVFILGYNAYPKFNPTQTNSDTTFIYDTMPHYIVDSFPYYITRVDSIKYRDQAWTDSVIKANKIDTAELLNDYYALHFLSREWKDSLIYVSLKDVVSENKFYDATFTYQILRPQEVINNVINNYSYSRYLYLGASLNISEIKNSEFALFYAFSRGYAGLGYAPLSGGLSLKGGVALFKLR